MAKVSVVGIDFSINSVPFEDDLQSLSLDVTQEMLVTTSFSDAGPRRLVGNYDYSHSLGGAVDFTDAQSDATLFAMIANERAIIFEPLGTTAGASSPVYNSTCDLASYTISCSSGAPIMFDATLQGSSAMDRDVTP